ncbi:unnamed protein product [Effrenium voratum]|nr:unnamed protein product [Effrenium voratum]
MELPLPHPRLSQSQVAHVAHAAWTPIPANFAGLPPASRRLGLALLAARLRRCQRRVASLDRPVKRLRARRRPPAPVMSQRTALEQAPSLEFLGTCLASGRLEEADQVTRDLLLVLAGGPALARGFLQPEEVPGISAEDLRALDRLWVKYSEGRLGYSVQRERLEAAGGDFQKFMHEIGWLQGPEPMLRFWPRREFDYSLTAPQGHLPLTNLIRGRELLLALLRHPAFAGAATAATADVPVVKEATTPEVRDWWAKLTGGADDEELDSTTDPEQTSIERPPESFEERGPGEVCFRITLITGFETFNARLYRSAARQAADVPGLSICVFTDKDIAERRAVVQQALETTDVFFCSLIFDFDQAEWLREACQHIEVRMIFESALELMSCTKVGSFAMSGGGGGMPPAVRSLISSLTGQREEDRIAGYTKFLKTGPKLLQFLPQLGPIPDLRRWLQSYALWSGGGRANVAKMLRYLAHEFGQLESAGTDGTAGDETSGNPLEVVEIPQVGLLHPARKFAFQPGPFWQSPRDYLDWYRSYKPEAFTERWPRVAVLLYRKHVVSELSYIWQLVNYFEEKHQILPIPIFIQGVDAHIAVRDLLTSDAEREAVASGKVPKNRTLSEEAIEVDAVVNTIGFPLVGGPAGSMEGGRNSEIAKEILTSLNVPYFVAAPLLIQDVNSWREQGIGGLQGVVLYALPELDGAIDAVALGGLVPGGDIELLPDRVDRLAGRLKRWVRLRRTPSAQRKVAIILYGYPPGIGATGTAALLNVPQSLHRLLVAMKEQGYDVGDLPEDPEELIREITAGDQAADSGAGFGDRAELAKGAAQVEVQQLAEWLPRDSQEAVESKWGEGLAQSGIRAMGSALLLGGRKQGNVWLAVQPPLGVPGDPMRLLFERDMTPHPQYVAFYKYIENELEADAVVHFGMHGTAEWLPGKPLGNMGSCWPDQLLGPLPNVYLYAANNPSESILAKRRGYGCLVSYNVPPYARAGLYKELQTLRGLLAEFMESREDTGEAERLRSVAASEGVVLSGEGAPQDAEPTLEAAVIQAVLGAGLQKDLPLPKKVQEAMGAELDPDAAARAAAAAFGADFADYAGRLRAYLAELEASLFSEGLHTLGAPPGRSELEGYLTGCFDGTLPPEAIERLAAGAQESEVVGSCVLTARDGEETRHAIKEALRVRELLASNTEEVAGMLRALNGEFVPPAPGGDLIRDGASVLPTGRNIHALDPFRIPSQTALQRGIQAAEKSIEQYRRDNDGAFPETIAVNLWGLEAIKTRGESVAVVLGLIGARPVAEATGRVARYELIPLEELGRPRVDALCSLSGIFRDSFANVVELLDDALQRAAKADEAPEQNFVRKHYLELLEQEKDEDAALSRIFSNAAGEFGSLVNERVVAGNWENDQELGETWASRNAFAFGRNQRGTERGKVLDKLLGSSGSLVQLTDSVEYGLTDIQEYYANSGAMVRRMSDLQKRKVEALVVDTTQKQVAPRKLDSVLRMEYRTKLLNPKWAEAMVAQGSGGAFEVSQRMTALLGWGGTTRFAEDWVWNQSAERYVLDEDMAKRLRESNPEAFRNIVGRLLEAKARDLWQAPEDVLQRLSEIYEELDDELEGVA